jgi:hypothetical protein
MGRGKTKMFHNHINPRGFARCKTDIQEKADNKICTELSWKN